MISALMNNQEKFNCDIQPYRGGEVKTLPRYDLQERAFRKYEAAIAEACKGSVVITPPIKMSAYSYMVRFRDACLGYRRYGYKSDMIPPGYDLTMLKPEVCADGKVLIRNLRVADAIQSWEGMRLGDERTIKFLELASKIDKVRQCFGVPFGDYLIYCDSNEIAVAEASKLQDKYYVIRIDPPKGSEPYITVKIESDSEYLRDVESL